MSLCFLRPLLFFLLSPALFLFILFSSLYPCLYHFVTVSRGWVTPYKPLCTQPVPLSFSYYFLSLSFFSYFLSSLLFVFLSFFLPSSFSVSFLSLPLSLSLSYSISHSLSLSLSPSLSLPLPLPPSSYRFLVRQPPPCRTISDGPAKKHFDCFDLQLENRLAY